MGFGYSVHLIFVIVLHQSLKVTSFGVDLPGSCAETNKNVKPDPKVTLESLVGTTTEAREYGAEPIDKVCATHNFALMNETTLKVTKRYQSLTDPTVKEASIYVIGTSNNAVYVIVRQDASDLPMNSYSGFITYDDGNMVIWYLCRDIGDNLHEAQGFITLRKAKFMTNDDVQAADNNYMESGIDPQYFQAVDQTLPQCIN